MSIIDSVFYIVILIFSIVIHEVAHGYVAYRFGDTTARDQGRLTLNPLSHLEWFGSVILPAILILSGTGFVFGWAKPVPYNPFRLRNERWGTLAVVAAGIVVNLFVAIFFGMLMRVLLLNGIIDTGASTYAILKVIIFLNIVLAFFNIMPVPPLDGSKILFSLLGQKFKKYELFMERYSIVILLFFVVFVWQFVAPVLFKLFSVITGQMF